MKYLRGSLVVLIGWYLLALLMHSPIIPYPHAVFVFLLSTMQTTKTYLHLLFSLYRIAMGMALALFFAIPTGMVAGRKKRLDQFISPVLYLLYPLPKIAFLPVFMVLFGIGDLSKIILIAVIVFFPAAVTIRDGVKEIPMQYLELAKAYRLTPRQVITDIVWPAILPRIFSSLRITLGISLSVLFISENYAATYGLGYYIMNNWVMAHYVGMYAGIVLLSLLGLGLYILLDALEKVVYPNEMR
ncbi:ABC transporter permease [Sphaerochaeta globosa]|uniref:ABC-type transporter, integral membrane subunit n=1 Tax=Sphaerochaeta globosa (strain ATCC BAA-1886 / DSM 22777 / Buddy) TaxID=158189 RepID=F0RTA7_SPHGB|nr:ABC transporter permease [Sphaerochaeta globosa]ADY14401.1 ABC-type transporter, integral membrane subunit [Sphaerochaeta globosa str. Buddy]